MTSLEFLLNCQLNHTVIKFRDLELYYLNSKYLLKYLQSINDDAIILNHSSYPIVEIEVKLYKLINLKPIMTQDRKFSNIQIDLINDKFSLLKLTITLHDKIFNLYGTLTHDS